MADVEKAQSLEDLRLQGPPNPDSEISKATTASLTDVPTATRSGPEAQARLIDRLGLIPSVSDPKAYSRNLKWFITIIVSAAAAIDSITTNIFYRA